MRFRGPLADSYPAAVVLVLCALTPYLVLTTAIAPLAQLIPKDVHLRSTGLELTNGMANAAYCFGTVLAAQLVMRLPGRRLLIGFATTFIVGSVLAAWAPSAGVFVAGRVLQGLMTGLMLIAAVPPLVTGWPKEKMPKTAVVMNLGIFGAVALGPVVGGVLAGAKDWRLLFWVMAGLGVVALAFALLTFEDQEAQNRDAPIDLVAIALAAAGCAAAFYGASELKSHPMTSSMVLIPLVAGVLLIVATVAYEYRIENPLMPVERLAHTIPVAGILTAMFAGAASVALVQLVQTALQAKGGSPTHAGMLFWPEFGGALAAAALFGAIFLTRWVPLLALSGLVILGVGAAVLTGVARGPDALVVVGSGCVGVGTGASVSPGLFVTGFSLKSEFLPRVFALIELLRGVAAFLTGPILLHLSMTTGGKLPVGLRTATWVSMAIALGGALLVSVIWVAGRARLQRPDIDTWLADEGPAVESPPLGAGLRRRTGALSSGR